MATDPKDRTVTLSYPGGYVRLVRGLAEYCLNVGAVRWTRTGSTAGKYKRKYGNRQRSQSAGGKVAFLKLDDDSVWTVRFGGKWEKFVDGILSKAKPGKVIAAWTQSGTIADPEYIG
jgi:hypothetical protein